MPDEIIIEDDIGDSYFKRRKFQGDINSPAMEALRKHTSVLTKEGKPEITEEEIEKLRAGGMSAEEIQTQVEGMERDPWVDPTPAATAAFGAVGLTSLKAGVKLLPSLGRALTAGMVGGAAEYPLGMAAEKVEAGKYPGLTLPFAITVGLLSGVTVENIIEKAVIRSLTKKGVKPAAKAVSEGIEKVKADLKVGKTEDELTTDTAEELNKLILEGVKTKLASKELSLLDTIDPDTLTENLIAKGMPEEEAESLVGGISTLFFETEKPVKNISQLRKLMEERLGLGPDEIKAVERAIPGATIKGEVSELAEEAKKVGEKFEKVFAKKFEEGLDVRFVREVKASLGTTENVKEAGYILPDGSLLKLRKGEEELLYHSKILDVISDARARDFEEVTGSVRMLAGKNRNTFEIASEPNKAQMGAMRRVIDENPGGLTIDIQEGRVSKSIEKGTFADAEQLIGQAFKGWREEPTFRGWQETAEGKDVAYYNVGKDTMTKEGLARRGLEVPETPPSPKEIDEVMKIGDSRKPLIKIISEVEPKTVEFLGETISDLPEKAININLSRIDSPEDIKEILVKTAKVYEAGIEEARRGVVSHAQTSRLANLLGMTPEQLLKRQRGQAFNDAEALAARRILVSSAEALMESRLKILSGEATDLDKFAFEKAFATHYAIQAQVSGVTTEAARTLQSLRIKARSSEGKVKEIKQFMESLGTSRGVTADELALMLDKMDSVEGITRFVKEAQKATAFDMVIEAWINGLLSGPQTHAVNTLSNTLVAFWQIPERLLASGFGKILPGKGEISAGEAIAQGFGLIQGFKDGMKLFGKALWTGESDTFSKIEVRHRRAISARNLDIDEAGLAGRAVDLLGEGVRIPGRFLGAEDEFFKAIGYRMELWSRAYRTAMQEGLSGDAAAKRMQQIVNEPPDDIRLDAMDAARYQTFTQELGKFGKGVQSIFSEVPALKLIAPFIRTPINIMKFAGERTPLAIISRRIRGDIMAGGAKRDLALARISLGSMVMATTATLAADGVITGGGPSDPALRNIKRNTGWQPYSIKVGEKYYAYNRLEPLGVLLGMAADITEIAGELSRGEAENLTVLAVAGLSKNVLSKTWLRGLSETLTMLSDPGRYGQRWVQKYVESVVPTGVAQLERVVDPTMGQVDGYIDSLKARIPGYSATLPPRRNLWAEPIILEGGLGPDIVSPVYVSTEKYSPIDEELLRLRVPLSMPRKTQSIHGESIELSVEEYDRFLVFMNEIPMPDTGKNLKATLDHLVTKSPEYRNMPEDQKEMRIRSYLVMAKALAREKLWEETSDIKWLVDSLQLERMQVQ